MNPQIRRLALDLGPLLIFFAAFRYLGIFGATACFHGGGRSRPWRWAISWSGGSRPCRFSPPCW